MAKFGTDKNTSNSRSSCTYFLLKLTIELLELSQCLHHQIFIDKNARDIDSCFLLTLVPWSVATKVGITLFFISEVFAKRCLYTNKVKANQRFQLMTLLWILKARSQWQNLVLTKIQTRASLVVLFSSFNPNLGSVLIPRDNE